MDLKFYFPLSGPVVPLDDIPDPVFAQRMAGHGLTIDPLDLGFCCHAATQVHRKRHALTLTTTKVSMLELKYLITVVLVANNDRSHPTNPSNILNDYECSFLC